MITKDCLFPCFFPMNHEEIKMEIVPTPKCINQVNKYPTINIKVEGKAKKVLVEQKELTLKEMIQTLE